MTKQGVSVSLDELMQLRFAAKSMHWLKNNKVASKDQGGHLSRRRGRGLDFTEVRVYQSGDDLRAMDWRVTARTGEPHIKLYTEELEQPLYVLLDLSPSMYFGTRVAFKSVVAIQAAALLAWTALQQGERFGAIVMAGNEIIERPARRRQTGVLATLKLLSELSQRAPLQTAPDTLYHALLRLRPKAKAGSIVFVLSDFNALSKAAKNQLQQLSQYTDCFVGLIHDPLEEDLPPPNVYSVTDGTKTLLINTAIKSMREHYHRKFAGKCAELKALAASSNISLLDMPTYRSVIDTLQTVGVQHG